MRAMLMAVIIATTFLGGTTPAQAVEVFFNGVRVSGLKNQSFRNCQVRFDTSGNVYITAKGYSVKRVEDNDTPPKAPINQSNITKQYYLFSQSKRPRMAQYDVDVFINGKWVRKIRNNESQVVIDVTKHLHRGKNMFHFSAIKNYGGKVRQSTSATDKVRVFIGTGTKSGGTVNITNTLADFAATAAQTDNFNQEQTISVP